MAKDDGRVRESVEEITAEIEERKQQQREQRLLKQREKEIRERRSRQERLVAPFLLILTILLSLLAMALS